MIVERDRLSIEDEETLKNFDLDWKKSRSRLPEMSYNFKKSNDTNMLKFGFYS